jgi:hypothetical protein
MISSAPPVASHRGKRRKPPPRLVLSYIDGSWSDRIAARRLEVQTHGSEITLTLELTPRAKSAHVPAAREAMRELSQKQNSLESLQVTRPRVVARLRHELRNTENVVIRVRLLAPGVEVEYPGSVVFGPDAVTLTFG